MISVWIKFFFLHNLLRPGDKLLIIYNKVTSIMGPGENNNNLTINIFKNCVCSIVKR